MILTDEILFEIGIAHMGKHTSMVYPHIDDLDLDISSKIGKIDKYDIYIKTQGEEISVFLADSKGDISGILHLIEYLQSDIYEANEILLLPEAQNKYEKKLKKLKEMQVEDARIILTKKQ